MGQHFGTFDKPSVVMRKRANYYQPLGWELGGGSSGSCCVIVVLLVGILQRGKNLPA
jgi:hypothetical protein